MAGQVKHRQIFSGIVPDLKLMGAAGPAGRQEHGQPDRRRWPTRWPREGITLLPSTALLQDQLAAAGAMTRRAAFARGARRTSSTAGESRARSPGMDLGQTVVVKDRAAVALEAMEGTDEVIRRAGRHRRARAARW